MPQGLSNSHLLFKSWKYWFECYNSCEWCESWEKPPMVNGIVFRKIIWRMRGKPSEENNDTIACTWYIELQHQSSLLESTLTWIIPRMSALLKRLNIVINWRKSISKRCWFRRSYSSENNYGNYTNYHALYNHRSRLSFCSYVGQFGRDSTSPFLSPEFTDLNILLFQLCSHHLTT